MVRMKPASGKLYITEDELIFKASRIYFLKLGYRISVKNIGEFNTLFFPHPVMTFIEDQGKKKKFIVNGRKNRGTKEKS